MSTYSQIYVHIIFAVKGRESLILPPWESRLYKYVTGIVQNMNQKMIAVNGISNHIHILIGMRPTCCLSDLVREVKKSSNTFINENKFSKLKFNWQEGFGAFSCSHNQLDQAVAYVMNQKEHHAHKTFREEYLELMEELHIPDDDGYIKKWLNGCVE